MSNRSSPVGEEERRINRAKVDSDETEDSERRSYRLAIGARGLRGVDGGATTARGLKLSALTNLRVSS